MKLSQEKTKRIATVVFLITACILAISVIVLAASYKELPEFGMEKSFVFVKAICLIVNIAISTKLFFLNMKFEKNVPLCVINIIVATITFLVLICTVFGGSTNFNVMMIELFSMPAFILFTLFGCISKKNNRSIDFLVAAGWSSFMFCILTGSFNAFVFIADFFYIVAGVFTYKYTTSYCENCGAELSKYHKFCTKCGAKNPFIYD